VSRNGAVFRGSFGGFGSFLLRPIFNPIVIVSGYFPHRRELIFLSEIQP
jgi:hypothetical protein